MTERWSEVDGWPYEASDCGRVRATPSGRILRQSPGRKGYLRVTLRRPGEHRMFHVGALVLSAFVGPRPSARHQVAHENGANTDNRLDNLAWKTARDNNLQKNEHGTMCRGERHPMSKLSEQDVLDVRRLYRAGMSHRQLAAQFRLSSSTIGELLRGENWAHVREA